MLIKKSDPLHIPSSEITPQPLYLSRRQFMTTAVLTGTAGLLAACTGNRSGSGQAGNATAVVPAIQGGNFDELGDPLNDYQQITNYNNFYEFNTTKDGPARLAKDFPTSPWQIEVGGLVNKPKTYGLEDLAKFDQEERIYRLRCVEAWSMVIPWNGFPLAKILNEVEPTAQAKYVRFETIYDPDNMPGQKSPFFPWPYIEGLTVEEAMHDLTILATGLYGQPLLPQNGAPVRLVVPWKYGFKSIKSIVKIDLVEEMPTSLWMASAPHEYGFFANVHPEMDHPRWSQATERRIGEMGRRETLLFNGYAEQVAHLYPDPTYDTTG